jgi:formylglycine-generating enzyme
MIFINRIKIYKMNKKPLLMIICLLIGMLISGVNKKTFDPYTQEISGTTLSFKMVPIPSGEFIMGTPNQEVGHKNDESPQRKIKIDPFWMGEHEVTWELFEIFLDKEYEKAISNKPLTVEVDGISRPTIPYLDMTFGMGKGKKPALAMTQYGAIQFCKWLYTKTGVFYRLPTEAEWEYAARAGSTGPYFFSKNAHLIEEYAVFAGNSNHSTQVVGSKKPNPWGLYDMLGNVMEWTYDHYAPYIHSKSTLPNPVVVSNSLYPQVLRGGHYQSPIEDLRSGKRFASDPVWKQLDPQIPKSKWWFPEAPFVGMRLVRPLQKPSDAEISAYYDKAPISDY